MASKNEMVAVVTREELKAFQLSYCRSKEGKYDLRSQIPHLTLLAERYYEKYQRSHKWTDMLRAHALFNSIGYREPDNEKWRRKSFKVQETFMGELSELDYENHEKLTTNFKRQIERIREEARRKLRDVNEVVETMASCNLNHQTSTAELESLKEFYSKIKDISISCTNSMIELSRQIFRASVDTLVASPPCRFCVVAIGSMAKGEATPYSDLEYLFLIERKSEETIAYFRALAIMGYFIIGNLRETKLKYMAIPELSWFDDKQKNGFKFDGLGKGAGNIPTGNGSEETENHFIMTPNELLQRYTQVLHNPIKKEAARGDLTAMLQYTALLFTHGKEAERLLEEFTTNKSKIQINPKRKDVNNSMFEQDMNKFSFRPNQRLIDCGYSVDSKDDLYRYPSILLFDLSIMLNFQANDSWSTIEELTCMGHMSQSFYQSLSFLLACGCYFRLSAYLHHDSHDERISVLPSSANQQLPGSQAQFGDKWYLPQSIFNKYCEYSIPLKAHVLEWKGLGLDPSEIIRLELLSPSWIAKFQTYHFCHSWKAAWKCFETSIQYDVASQQDAVVKTINRELNNNHTELWHTVKALCYILIQERCYGIAIIYCNLVESMCESVECGKDIKLILADIMVQVSNMLIWQHKYQEAKSKYEKALSLRLEVLGNTESDDLVSNTYFCLGRCYRIMDSHLEAEDYLLTALHISHGIATQNTKTDCFGGSLTDQNLLDLRNIDAEKRVDYLNNISVSIIQIIYDLGNLYINQHRYDLARIYYGKTITMLGDLYGIDACHREIYDAYYSLAYAYDCLDNHKDAGVYFKMCMQMLSSLFGGKELVDTLHLKEKEDLQTYHQFVINTFLELPGYKVPHPQTARVLLRYGKHIGHVKQFPLADSVLTKSLTMYTSLAIEMPKSVDIPSVMAAQAEVLGSKGAHVDALSRYEESLVLLKELNNTSSLFIRADVEEKIGRLRLVMDQSDEAQFHFKKAKELYILASQGCRNRTHPKIHEMELLIQK